MPVRATPPPPKPRPPVTIPNTVASKIELLQLSELKPAKRQTRTHSERQIAAIMGSFGAFGLINPIIVDADNNIVCGNARFEAAKRLNLLVLPVIRVTHLTRDDLRAYAIADNRIAELAGWDPKILADELEYLCSIDLSFDISAIGFSVGEIDAIFDQAKKLDGEIDEEATPEIAAGPAVSRIGDLWIVGRHHLICGNALDAATHATLMNGQLARMALTDPPYNIGISGSARGKGSHREFAMASGEMSEAEFVSFLAEALARTSADVMDGGLVYSFMDHRHMFELLSAARANDLTQINICVWDKLSGGMGSFYRSRHEFCGVFKVGSVAHLNNVELGKHGRDRSNVWPHPGLNVFGRNRDEDLKAHPTVKPWPLLAEAIKDCSKRGEIVVDPFAGSGSTLVAAAKSGRIGYGIELDPLYVDTAVKRLTKTTGLSAILSATGQTYEAMAAERLSASVDDVSSDFDPDQRPYVEEAGDAFA